MKRKAFLPFLSVAALSMGAVLAGGCVAGSAGDEEATLPEAPASAIGHEHLMLTEQAQAALPRAKPERRHGGGGGGGGLKLTYYGGPLIQNVNVIPVYWNAGVALQSDLDDFYSAISTGPYISFFSQYATTSPAQKIGNGTRGTPCVDDDTSTSVTDAQVQAELNRLFSMSLLPAPNNNNLYMVHFPAGTTVTASDNSKSCVVFCAYHSTYVRNGQDVYYGIIPDLGSGGCQNGCGGGTPLQNTQSVSSHELAESLTDPAVGLAFFVGWPLGWYNTMDGEIGDICNGQQGSAVLGDGKTYTVQKLWSNSAGLCVVPQ